MDEYSASDSDDDYNENEKILLQKARRSKEAFSESEEEVFGVGGNDSESEDQSDIALSDVEGQEDKDDLPDERAWGKDKRKFYSTDYVDADYGGFDGKDAQLAEFEEEEAKNLQKQLAQQLDDDDFSLNDIVRKQDKIEKASIETEEIIKSDITKLSKRQKIQLLQKESPEFFGLVDEFKENMGTANDFLKPVMEKYRKGQLTNSPAIDFVQTHYELILNYCVNIEMYFLLKSSRANIQNHPVVKRLYQYRQLLSQLQPVFDEVVKPQIKELLKETTEEVSVESKPKTKKKKTLKMLANLTKTEDKTKKTKKVHFGDEPAPKKAKLEPSKQENSLQTQENLSSDEEPQEMEQDLPETDENNELTKRKITYQIAKNKGLTPHRKKEQRNPRVKHRNKFRKANIRRKGAVREPRTEMKRYGGEMSGIKASVTKSIKIKS